MNESVNSVFAKIPLWAARQLADYDANEPGTLFAEDVRIDVDQGYELQTAVNRLRMARGERIIGYKVGCTSTVIRQQLGIDHCISGRLFDSERYASGSTLTRDQFANPAVEGELAIELSREPRDDDFLTDGIPACVARLFPVIELHNLVMRCRTPSAGELIANNAIHAGFVVSDSRDDKLQSPCEPGILSIFMNDRRLDGCPGDSLLRTLRSSLAWLNHFVRQRGEHLEEGTVILTGSVPSLIPIKEDCLIRVDAFPFGQVEATFTSQQIP